MERAKRVYQLDRVCLGDVNHVLAQLIQLLVCLGLAVASSKRYEAVAPSILPLVLLKVDVASLVNNVIRVRCRNIPKAFRIQALVNEINCNAAYVAHVLHGGYHYGLAQIRLLDLDKFHCKFLATHNKKC